MLSHNILVNWKEKLKLFLGDYAWECLDSTRTSYVWASTPQLSVTAVQQYRNGQTFFDRMFKVYNRKGLVNVRSYYIQGRGHYHGCRYLRNTYSSGGDE